MNSSNQNGAVLIAIIIAMMLIAALGLITLSLNTISAYSQLNVNNFNKAYYLAESGCKCIKKEIFPMPDTSNDYILADGGKISVKRDGIKTSLITGIVNQGTIFEAVRQIYCIDIPSLLSCGTFIPDGLSYWNFNDKNNPGKDYWGGKDAVLNGVTAWSDIWQNDFTNCITAFEGVDGFLKFDGSNIYLTTPFNQLSIGINKPFTVLLWAKPTILGTLQTVLGTTDGTNHFSLGIDSSDKWYWEYGDKSSATSIAADNTWQHIALIYTGNPDKNIIIYFNGKKSEIYDYGASGGNAAMPDKDLFIGAKNNNGTGAIAHFKGSLDETAIYDRVLTICEIREFYNAVCHAGCEAVAYYPFNCNTDDESGWCKSGKGNNGTVNGAILAKDRFNCIERAYQFDGTDDYIGADTQLISDYPFTICAWIKTDGNIGMGEEWFIFSFTDKDADNIEYGIYIDGTEDGKAGIHAKNPDLRNSFSINPIDDGSWHFVAGVFLKADERKLYIDGVEEAADTINSVIFNSDVDRWSIGRLGNNIPKSYFKGVIDDVAVYNKGLEKEEIEKLALDIP